MIGYGGYLGLKALVVDFNQNHNTIINSLNEVNINGDRSGLFLPKQKWGYG